MSITLYLQSWTEKNDAVNPHPQVKDEAVREPKHTFFPILDLEGVGFKIFFIFFVQDCSLTLKQKFRFEILNGTGHFGLHT